MFTIDPLPWAVKCATCDCRARKVPRRVTSMTRSHSAMGDVLDRLGHGADAGVVDRQVQAAERFDGEGNQGPDLGRVGDVGVLVGGAPAGRPR